MAVSRGQTKQTIQHHVLPGGTAAKVFDLQTFNADNNKKKNAVPFTRPHPQCIRFLFIVILPDLSCTLFSGLLSHSLLSLYPLIGFLPVGPEPNCSRRTLWFYVPIVARRVAWSPDKEMRRKACVSESRLHHHWNAPSTQLFIIPCHQCEWVFVRACVCTYACVYSIFVCVCVC